LVGEKKEVIWTQKTTWVRGKRGTGKRAIQQKQKKRREEDKRQRFYVTKKSRQRKLKKNLKRLKVRCPLEKGGVEAVNPLNSPRDGGGKPQHNRLICWFGARVKKLEKGKVFQGLVKDPVMGKFENGGGKIDKVGEKLKKGGTSGNGKKIENRGCRSAGI